MFIFIVAVLLVPLLLYDKRHPVPSHIQLYSSIVILVIAAIITGVIMSKLHKHIGLPPKRPLREVKAELVRVKTSRAVKREDPEDFGVAFYLDVTQDGKRKTLFLWGQYLDELEYEQQFPNTEFVLIRRSDTKELIDIELKGTYFPPERTVPPFPDEIWKQGSFPSDGEIQDLKIEEITI